MGYTCYTLDLCAGTVKHVCCLAQMVSFEPISSDIHEIYYNVHFRFLLWLLYKSTI